MTVKSLKVLGVYKFEFNEIIDIYAELLEQYTTLNAKFIEGGRKCVSYTADGGEKKSPLVATLESLRKDILQYSDRLMLNPKAHAQKIKEKTYGGESLADVLKNLSG